MNKQDNIIDIVKIIEEHPLARFSNNVQLNSKIANKCKLNFTTDEQKLFLSSFYCYLNHNNNEFIINLDNIWKWIGFSRFDNTVRLVKNEFKELIDYKILLLFSEEQKKDHGGSNKETILLTIKCFKKLCLKARTKKADEIHDYYIKMEEIMHEIMDEESTELKTLLLKKDQEIVSTKEKTMINAYHLKPIVYLATVENDTIKFGFTNDIKTRYNTHKKEIGQQFVLEYVVETVHNRELEQMIKDNFKDKRIEKEYNKKLQTELLKLDQLLTIEKLYKTAVLYRDSFDNGKIIRELSDENEFLKNEIKNLKIRSDAEKDGKYLYVQETNKVDHYIIDVTDNLNINCAKLYNVPNSKKIKKMTYLLLDAFRINENTFEALFSIIKDTIDYSSLAYNYYKIDKNDIYRFTYLQKYVNRNEQDKIIINENKEFVGNSIYQKYIDERLEYGQNYKTAIVSLHEDMKQWFDKNYPDVKFKNLQERIVKDDISRNFPKLIGIDKSIINTYDTNKKRQLSSYPGFIGIRIKCDNKTSNNIYSKEIYQEYFKECIECTNCPDDRIFKTELLNNFITFVSKKYTIHKDTKGSIRYTISFINEFIKEIKEELGICLNLELRCNKGKSKYHGGFLGIKLK